MNRYILLASLAALFAFSFYAFGKTSDCPTIIENAHIEHLDSTMQHVRDYVPKFAVMAHRGSTYWTPEETEAAYRWAREVGADYLECDLQCSKDGVILALHDDNLTRTTNIKQIYGDSLPETRKEYYIRYRGMTETEALAQCEIDRRDFVPYRAGSYMYCELMKLDAGSWFNAAYPSRACKGFSAIHQYVSTLEDLVNFARGNRLKRNAEGEREYEIVPAGDDGRVVYKFSYVKDTIAGDPSFGRNRPGIYIEFKEPDLNPVTFEQDVYAKLDELGFNIITRPEPTDAPYYIDGVVNVGNTNGKTVLQTFSKESLRRSAEVFRGMIPMCFLLWNGDGKNDIHDVTPDNYAAFINYGVRNKAHIMGPSIAGEPNLYPELDAPWMSALVRKSGMLNHPYSFDTLYQMQKYYGEDNETDNMQFEGPFLDGAFTNRSDITIQYFIDKGVRPYPAPQTVPNPEKLLETLGYK
ncbi:MAG: glycerophosphodiester phosphodiesterase family protein [Prevotellaceae bacterium]|nr:glycerophosphodiester phosphodiesterase family protein [Prevotellaceae bacterium]